MAILSHCRNSDDFGMLTDIDLLKEVTSPNPKTEVNLRHSGRHLDKKTIRRHISAESDPILMKCGMLTQNDMTLLRRRGQNLNWHIWRLSDPVTHTGGCNYSRHFTNIANDIRRVVFCTKLNHIGTRKVFLPARLQSQSRCACVCIEFVLYDRSAD